MRANGARDKLVVRVLRGNFFKLADDDGFFFNSGFDLSYEGGVYNFLKREKKIRLSVSFDSIRNGFLQ